MAFLVCLVRAGLPLADDTPHRWWERFLDGPVEGADDASILFALNAQDARVSDDELTLRGLDKGVIWFTDRPERHVGRIDTRHLIDVWSEGKDGFAADPPNAVVSGVDDGKTVALVVILESLRQDGEQLVFRVAALEEQSLPPSLSLTDVGVVIDGASTSFRGTFINVDNFGGTNVPIGR